MSVGVVTAAYIGAAILFILALGGLSHPETARRGNVYGIAGMTIALLATLVGVVTANYYLLLGALVVGGAIGLVLARRVQMTQMPELVAILHSLVGLAAMLVGSAIEFSSSTSARRPSRSRCTTATARFLPPSRYVIEQSRASSCPSMSIWSQRSA